MNDNLSFNYPNLNNNYYNRQNTTYYENRNNNYEEIYIENILKQNKGKLTKVYTSFNDSSENKNKIFTGIIEFSTPDTLIISDPSNGKWYVIKSIYIDYIEFDESVNYNKNII